MAAVVPRSDLYFGADATEEVLRTKGPTTRLLHLASHGHFRQDSPMFSGIRLGDGYLNLYDLYSLKLPAELATLSGCSTGAGVVSGGDEVRGLVRGLIHAGVQTDAAHLVGRARQEHRRVHGGVLSRLRPTRRQAQGSP